MPYAEFPADEIIDCHFKKKEPPDGDGEPPFPGAVHLCGAVGRQFTTATTFIGTDPPQQWPPIGVGDVIPPEWLILLGGGGALREGEDYSGFNPDLVNQQGCYVINYESSIRSGDMIYYDGPLESSPIVEPRAAGTWTTSFGYYLTGIGIYYNPWKRRELDSSDPQSCTMALPLPNVVGYEIKWTSRIWAIPQVGGTPPSTWCGITQSPAIGLGIANKITHGSGFQLTDQNTAPSAPNFGAAGGGEEVPPGDTGYSSKSGTGAYYDVISNGDAILYEMIIPYLGNSCAGFEQGDCGPRGCGNIVYGTESLFQIRAFCRGSTSGGRRGGRYGNLTW